MSEEKKKTGFFGRLFKRNRFEDKTADEIVSEEARLTESEQEPPGQQEILKQIDDSGLEDSFVEQEDTENLNRLKTGLTKTRTGFLKNLDEIFLDKRELDEQVLTRLEEALVRADIGVQTSYQLLERVTDRVKRREIDDPEKVIKHIKEMIKESLEEVESPLRVGYGAEPFVMMVVGVNGSGKTTTIAKIAARHKAADRKVMLVAGDTFRAAAVEQLQIWGDRIGCEVVKGKAHADPSSVAFEAIERAVREDFELVLVDTAGRLHTRIPLMEELKKLRRTLGKKISTSPHETLLVIDASMGQNAILQARTFNEAIPVTGIALTKLDGTSKGGVIVSISKELKIPIRFVGIGEKMDDLRDFNARQFAEALFSIDESTGSD
ncbi:MAG: signal recognition particle-docking protein FtsY [Deltaproteobacteria bacterium]|nr:signal recognition particle-docking protein FtsY [Deltaproteobacteria bacterium]